MSFFDFHLHSALKSQFNDVDKRDVPWQTFKLNFPTIDSQSSLSQLVKGKANLVGMAIHVPEPNMAVELNKLLKSKALAIRIFRVIKSSTFKMLKGLLSAARLEELGNQDVNSYQVLLQELDNLEKNTQGPRPDDRLVFLRTAADFKADATDTVFAFIVVEGIHSFKGSQPMNTSAGIQQIMDNIRDLCTRPGIRVIAVNPAHLQNNFICNHSFGIKIFDNKKFYPVGSGIINPDAFNSIVGELYRRNILADIKHMSPKARDDFYKWRADKNITQPIVSTHAGIAGLSRKRAGHFVVKKPKRVQQDPEMLEVEYYKPLGLVERTSFNISSINLYDEDIVRILESDGLIGISLDRRIIGFTEYFIENETTDLEYLSKPEYDFLFGADGPSRDANSGEMLDFDTHTDDDNRNWPVLDARYFLNQVLYILKLAEIRSLLPQAMKGICIGSDFDGMIDSVFCCRTAVDFQDFYDRAKKELPKAAQEAGVSLAGKETLIDDIFFSNGKNFVLNRIDSVDVSGGNV